MPDPDDNVGTDDTVDPSRPPVAARDATVSASDATVATSSGTDGASSSARRIRPPGTPAADAADYPQLGEVDPQHYVIGAKLAEGGMGQIVAGRDRRLGRAVAIKSLRVGDAELAVRFEREVRITAKLQHPAIVPIFEAGHWPNGEPFYAMKLVEGRSFDEAIAACTTLGERLALLSNVIAIAEAIAYAHDHRVIHRDIKPRNVIVGAYGETVVIDWGLAKDLDASKDADISIEPKRTRGRAMTPSGMTAEGTPEGSDLGETVAGDVLGTPAYMPLEQAHGEPVDERADVYSIGALLYHLLANRPPYSGTSATAVIAALLAAPPRPLSEVQEGLPSDLVAIVETAMARDKMDRYPSAKELAVDLRKFANGQLVGAHQYSKWQLVRRWVRRYRGVVIATTIALVALGVFGAYSIHRIIDERDRAEKQQRMTNDREENLAVEHAREIVGDDPTMALVALRKLSPTSPHWTAVRPLIVDAAHRGVAHRVIRADDTITQRVVVGADGTIVSGGADGIIRSWAPDGTPRPILSGHAGNIVELAIASDRTLVSRGVDGTVRVWRDGVGRNLVPPGQSATQLAGISHDGTAVAFVTHEAIYTCPVATGACTRLVPAEPSGVHGRLEVSENGKTMIRTVETWADRTFALVSPKTNILVACESDRVTVWDLATSRERYIWRGSVTGCGFAPDGRIAYTLHESLFFLDPDHAAPNAHFVATRSDAIAPIVFSADGSRAASSSPTTIVVFDGKTGKYQSSTRGRHVTHIAITPNGSHIAYASLEGVTVVAPTMVERHDPDLVVLRKAREVEIMADGAFLIGFIDGSLRAWNPKPPGWHAPISVTAKANASPDGSKIVLRDGGEMLVFDATTKQLVGKGRATCDAELSRDGSMALAKCEFDDTTGVWHQGVEDLTQFPGSGSWLSSGRIFVWRWKERDVSIRDDKWNVVHEVAIPPPAANGKSALVVARVARTADRAVVVTSENTAVFIDASSGKVVRVTEPLACPDTAPKSLSWDGKRYACADGAAIWLVGEDGSVAALRGHVDHVVGLEFMSDGSLASIGRDGRLRIWTDDRTSRVFELDTEERDVTPIAGANRSLVTVGAKILAWDLDAGRSFQIRDAKYARSIGDGHTFLVSNEHDVYAFVDDVPHSGPELYAYIRAKTDLRE